MTKLAILFPGQGSQQVGMLSDIAEKFPQLVSTFAEASEVLGYDLWELVQSDPNQQLNETQYTQPALLTAGVAMWRILFQECDLHPSVLAGHSLGEYTALVVAKSLSFKDAVKLVAARGRFMQSAVPRGEGGMAAIIGLENQVVSEICSEAAEEDVLTPANLNAIGQVVVAGHQRAVERVLTLAKEKGAKLAKAIPVSVPSHCQLMEPAAEELAQAMTDITFNAPEIPVIHNVDVSTHDDPAEIRQCLTEQLSRPVRWVETIQSMSKIGVGEIVECGPGKVLSGLVKRIDQNITLHNTSNLGQLEETMEHYA